MTKHGIFWAAAVAVLCLCNGLMAGGADDADQAVPPPHVGKYYRAGDMQDFTTLKPDGAVLIHQDGEDFRGEYRVRDGSLQITLTVDGEELSLTGKIRGRTIVDDEKEEWIRPEHRFTDRTVRQESFFELHDRMPKGWLLRSWKGNYYICKRPKGPPPPRLEAEAIVVVLPHGESNASANARNMIADTPKHSVHLSLVPSGTLWPTAKEDMLDVFLTEASSEPSAEANDDSDSH